MNNAVGRKENSNFNNAKKIKNDEFYTKLTDIEKELKHYKEHFCGKTVICNCDDPRVSNFFHYFSFNFEALGLKKLITTCYKNQERDFFSKNECDQAVYLEYEGDKNGNHIPDAEEIGVKPLKGDGDFRSAECIELLKQADIVVTNPPFSMFKEYIKVLMANHKDFVVMGNMNALKYYAVFPYVKENKIRTGYGFNKVMEFDVPDTYNSDNGVVRVPAICWYTTFPISKHNDELILFRKYTPELYPKYDNYDAINVDKLCDIPEDYDGVIGVPISFLDKYNPKQFEILGQTSGRFEFGIGPTFKYEQALCHNIDGSIINGSKINTEPCFLNKEKPVNQIYYTASNRDGYIHPIYTRILIRKIK